MIVPAVVVLVIYRWLIRLAGHYTTFLQKLLARGQGAASTILVIIALGLMPLTYFIEKPFQNWTYEGAEQLGSVLLHVDLHGAGGPGAAKARRNRAANPVMGRPGGGLAGDRHSRAYGRVACPDERAQPRAGLGPALRGPGETDRVSPSRISQCVAEAANGACRRSHRCEEFRVKLTECGFSPGISARAAVPGSLELPMR